MEKKFESVPPPEYIDIFHDAQEKLLAGDTEAGIEELVKAIEAGSVEEGEEAFVWYMKGTLAYVEKDQESLMEAISNLGKDPNGEILGRFLARLESGKEPDYKNDYGQGAL